jgi:hypothetical protein
MRNLAEALWQAISWIEILLDLPNSSDVMGTVADFNKTLLIPDDLIRRLLVTFSTPPERRAMREIYSTQDNGWEVRQLHEFARSSNGLQYAVIDRQVAFIGGGETLSRRDLNRKVTDAAAIDSLVAHYRQLWHRAQPPQILELLYRDAVLTGAPTLAASLAIVTEDVWRQIIIQLQNAPTDIFKLSPRQFEELVAHLLRTQGYEVELTRASKDDGRDILVAVPQTLGNFLYLVECKHYSQENRVGVRRVRELYGIVEQQRATAGVLITTSSFTRAARAFQKPVERRLSLREYDDLVKWLRGRSPLLQ